MNFELTTQHKRIQAQCRELATDFATRAAEHDREASNPVENYALLREAGFHTLNIPTELGGWGEQLFGHSLALEQLALGCPATALSFNMHLAWVGYLMENIEIDARREAARGRLGGQGQQSCCRLDVRGEHLGPAGVVRPGHPGETGGRRLCHRRQEVFFVHGWGGGFPGRPGPS